MRNMEAYARRGQPIRRDPTAGENNPREDPADSSPNSICIRGCATCSPPPTAITRRSTASIRADWPRASSTSTSRRTQSGSRRLAFTRTPCARWPGDRRARHHQPQRSCGRTHAGRSRLQRLLSDRLHLGHAAGRQISRIKVRVKRRGIEVRARKGFWARHRRRRRACLAPPEAPGAIQQRARDRRRRCAGVAPGSAPAVPRTARPA